jgi:solute:Na+ symporter, SSS family
MLLGFCVEVYLWQFTRVPWTWWVVIGTVVTFGSGYLLSVIRGESETKGV